MTSMTINSGSMTNTENESRKNFEIAEVGQSE